MEAPLVNVLYSVHPERRSHPYFRVLVGAAREDKRRFTSEANGASRTGGSLADGRGSNHVGDRAEELFSVQIWFEPQPSAALQLLSALRAAARASRSPSRFGGDESRAIKIRAGTAVVLFFFPIDELAAVLARGKPSL